MPILHRLGVYGLLLLALIAPSLSSPQMREVRIAAANAQPSFCGGNWYAPDNPYQLVASGAAVWYQNDRLGDLRFGDRSYARYMSYFRDDVPLSEAIGVNPIVWDVVTGVPGKIVFPNSVPGIVGYLTVETCAGSAPQRSYNWSRQGDREYYFFADSILVRSNSYGWHEVRGAINSKYKQLKGWTGLLGIPTSDELAVTGGRVSHFTGGKIFWAPATGAAVLRADQYDKWQALGGSSGPLGNPIGDNVDSPNTTTTGTTSPTAPNPTHIVPFQNNCRIVVDRSGTRAFCNGREVTSWTPPGSPPVSSPVAPPNAAPVARFGFTRKAGAGNIVFLDGASSTDPDGRIASWRWTKGGTPIGSGSSITASMGNVTSAAVTLTVTDNRGATASVTKTLSLPNRSPAIAAVSPPGGSTVGSNTPTLYVTATDDDGEALQYSFRVTGPAVDVSSGWVDRSWTVPPFKLDPGTQYTWNVVVRDARGATVSRNSIVNIAALPTAKGLISTPTGNGYWQVATDGGVFAFGDAQFYGSLPGLGVKVTNILGMARTPTGKGYWLVGADGGVFAFGDAGFFGSLPGLNIRVGNIVGMAPTKDGKGYWLVGSDGGVFAFGSAGFYGSMGGKPLNKPVVALAVSPSSQGYWLAAGDGGVFAFGDAGFYGSMGGQPLNAPVTDIAPSPDGRGYWMAAEDGGVFAFGSARFFGSMAGKPLNGHITGLSPLPNGTGYWLNGCDGGIFAFGNAQFYGSLPRYGCRGVLR